MKLTFSILKPLSVVLKVMFLGLHFTARPSRLDKTSDIIHIVLYSAHKISSTLILPLMPAFSPSHTIIRIAFKPCTNKTLVFFVSSLLLLVSTYTFNT